MVSRHISSDIVFEILTRITSLKTLGSCRLVCKEWRQLTNELRFMSAYCARTKKVYGYFIQGYDLFEDKFSSKLVPIVQPQGGKTVSGKIDFSLKDEFKILASCKQGLFCCLKTINMKTKYCVCKPATEQWQPLPDPNIFFSGNFGIMVVKFTKNLRYNIVKLSEYWRGVEVEIFDSELWAWSQIEDSNSLLQNGEHIIPQWVSPAIFTENYFHWLTNHKNVIVFCPSTRSFRPKIQLPEQMKNKPAGSHNGLCEYQGKLGFTNITSKGYMELWLKTDNSTNNEWTVKFVVNLENLNQHHLYARRLHFHNAEILVMRGYNQSVFYNIRDCTYNVVELNDELLNVYEIFYFQSDLEFVNLRPKRKYRNRIRLWGKSAWRCLREVL